MHDVEQMNRESGPLLTDWLSGTSIMPGLQ